MAIHQDDGGRVRGALDAGSEDSDEKESWSDTTVDSLDELPWLRGGRFVFRSRTTVERLQEYLMVNSESSMEDIAHFMTRTWRLPLPKVVVSVISSVNYFVVPNESWVEDLQYGILQSARLTNMYILTDGLNYGAARIIGEAVAQEKLRHRLGGLEEQEFDSREVGHITAIGVVSSDKLSYGQAIEEASGTKDENKILVLENIGDEKRELNPHHSHSIIMSCAGLTDKDAVQNILFNLEIRLPELLHSQHRERKATKGDSALVPNSLTDLRMNMRTPVVGLMLQGGPAEIERVLWLLKKQVPVIVITRQAAASGLLAYAFKEYNRG
ncbi:hypothetical protein RRG08_054580 [Elysia crispata]|uniref:TRPM SLOG domain-containing protein n=1 Tax=Elysia crispata TaxID=231223 RepID=A0AAE1E8L5_9GAST|nr:hypothetical protein RRG08_054580 [Elysia crispata]